MTRMFEDCLNINELKLLNFDTKNVKDMGGIFYGCNNLET